MLANLRLQMYNQNFIESGYDDYEWLLAQMHSTNPINDSVLQEDVKIDKIGHRQRFLIKLHEDSENWEWKEDFDEKMILDNSE